MVLRKWKECLSLEIIKIIIFFLMGFLYSNYLNKKNLLEMLNLSLKFSEVFFIINKTYEDF